MCLKNGSVFNSQGDRGRDKERAGLTEVRERRGRKKRVNLDQNKDTAAMEQTPVL